MITFIFKGSFGGRNIQNCALFFCIPCVPLVCTPGRCSPTGGRASEHRAHSCKGNGVINVFDARKACRSIVGRLNGSTILRSSEGSSSTKARRPKRHSNMPDQEDFCTARLRFSLVIHISGNSTTASYRASFRRRSGIWIYTKRMPHWKWIF